jgi:tetrahydromethanopterin:alpha-L-glutamate ligase
MPRSPERIRPARRGSSPRIVVICATRDWHARTLTAALKRRGADIVSMRLEDCVFDTGAPSGLRFGCLEGLPDGVFVRTISAGSFEAVTRRLGFLHALTALGVPVWNNAVAIERCVDKSMTTFLLDRAGLPVPQSWAVEGLAAACRVAAAECASGPLVAKPLFGSQGRGLVLVRKPDDLPPQEQVAEVYYLQRFVGGPGPEHCDFRVFVIAGRVVAAMARSSPNWITNVKRGGRPAAVPLDRELADLACAAAEAVGASFCGVDILRGPDGVAYVLEVNSMPAWAGLQSVSELDIADALADAFCRNLRVPVRSRMSLA